MTVSRLLFSQVCLLLAVCLYGNEAEEIRAGLPKLEGKFKLEAYLQLFTLSQETDDYREQWRCLNDYLAEAHRQGDQSKESDAREFRIILFYNNNQSDSVYTYAPDDLDFMRKNKVWSSYYRVWSFLVNTYIYEGSSSLGMQEAEKMYNDAKDRRNNLGLGLAYSAMGNAYFNMDNMDEAADAYQKSIDLLIGLHPVSIDLASQFSSLGDVLERIHNFTRLESLTHQWRSYIDLLQRDWNVKANDPDIAHVWVYYYLGCTQAALGQKDYDKAEKALDEARKRILTEDVDYYRSWVYYKARLLQQRQAYSEALGYNDKLMVLMASVDDKSELIRVRQQRAELMTSLGRHEEAARLYQQMYVINDSVNSHDAKRKLAEMNTIFHVDELKMKQAEEKARQQRRSIIAIASIIVLALVIFLYFRIRSAKRLKVAHEKLEETHSQLLTAYDQLEETTKAKERIESDLRIARNIQMSMVPSMFPDRPDLDLYASMTPAKEVGGDLYGYLLIGDTLYFALGDVSGKGVPASLFMAQATRLFRTLAAQMIGPADIATQINDALSGEDNATCMFVTMFIGKADLATGHLDFCNAGHNPPVLIGDGKAEFIDMIPNAPIGLWPGMQYEGEEIADISNHPLFVYTDGLNEAENPQKDQFSDERLLDILHTTPFESSQQTIELLRDEVEKHRDGAEPNDDLTMLCLNIIRDN